LGSYQNYEFINLIIPSPPLPPFADTYPIPPVPPEVVIAPSDVSKLAL
jgi:hypothetical protein